MWAALKHWWQRLVGAPEPDLGIRVQAPEPSLHDGASGEGQPPPAVRFDPRFPQS